jgi:regulator of CtrA degradation
MDGEWLLSTLFDASLLSTLSRRKRRLFFGFCDKCLVSCHFSLGYHFVNFVSGALDSPGSGGAISPRSRGEACQMKERSADEAAPVMFGEKLASSQAFSTLFRDGMALVEETAAYLDGPGRQESKKLERSAALTYATESMRLTTRLMQLASWLLLHRAVKEGEMSLAQANKEKTKVKLSAGEPGDVEAIKLLPEKLCDLIARSRKLNDQVRRLDANIYAPPLAPDRPTVGNPVERQLGLLKAAFETDSR